MNLTAFHVQESRDAQSIQCLFTDPSKYFPTGFKVMQNQRGLGLLPCTQVTQNGMIKLIYRLEGLAPLAMCAQQFSPAQFKQILFELIATVEGIKNNGFIGLACLSPDLRDVYVELGTLKIKFWYLPLAIAPSPQDALLFEQQLKRNLAELLQKYPQLAAEQYQVWEHYLRTNPAYLSELRSVLETDVSNSPRFNPPQPQASVDPYPQTSRQIYAATPQMAPPVMPQAVPQQAAASVMPKKDKKLIWPYFLAAFWVLLAGAAVYLLFFYLELNSLWRYLFTGTAVLLGIGAAILSIVLPRRKHKKEEAEAASIALYEIQAASGGATQLLDELFIPSLVICGIRTPEAVERLIDKAQFVLGKSPTESDLLIEFNNAISRKHALISYEEGRHLIMDLGSSNGTYLNGRRLNPNEKAILRAGDRLRLANSDFVLKVK